MGVTSGRHTEKKKKKNTGETGGGGCEHRVCTGHPGPRRPTPAPPHTHTRWRYTDGAVGVGWRTHGARKGAARGGVAARGTPRTISRLANCSDRERAVQPDAQAGEQHLHFVPACANIAGSAVPGQHMKIFMLNHLQSRLLEWWARTKGMALNNHNLYSLQPFSL